MGLDSILEPASNDHLKNYNTDRDNQFSSSHFNKTLLILKVDPEGNWVKAANLLPAPSYPSDHTCITQHHMGKTGQRYNNGKCTTWGKTPSPHFPVPPGGSHSVPRPDDMSWVTAQLVLPRKPPKGRAKETSLNRMQVLYSELIALSVSLSPAAHYHSNLICKGL